MHHPRRPLPDPARGDRHRQDPHRRARRRAGAKADAGDRPQQDPGRPALQRVPRVLPAQRGRVLRQLLRLLPARGLPADVRHLHREGQLDQRRHRPAAARRHGCAVLAARRADRCLGVVHLRHGLAGELRADGAVPGGRRRAAARGDAREAGLDPVLPQRRGAGPRQVPRPRRRDRGAAGQHGVGLPDLAVRRRGRVDRALRPDDRGGAVQARPPRHLPRHALRDGARADRPRGGRHRRRDERAAARAGGRGQDARGPPPALAHRVRHGDAARDGVLQRHRELLADPRGPVGGHAAAHAARLPARRLPGGGGRVAPDRAADRRHVRGRPVAQADAGRLRVPAAVGARQPAAAVRRVPGAGAAAAVRVGHARPLRAAQLDPRGRADHPPDRPDRPRGRGASRRGARSTT